jgi:hypothetical protein
MGVSATGRRAISPAVTAPIRPYAKRSARAFPAALTGNSFVADVEAAGRPLDGELHADLDEADFLAFFSSPTRGERALIGTVRDERADRAHTLKFEAVSDRAIKHLKVDVRRVNWF